MPRSPKPSGATKGQPQKKKKAKVAPKIKPEDLSGRKWLETYKDAMNKQAEVHPKPSGVRRNGLEAYVYLLYRYLEDQSLEPQGPLRKFVKRQEATALYLSIIKGEPMRLTRARTAELHKLLARMRGLLMKHQEKLDVCAIQSADIGKRLEALKKKAETLMELALASFMVGLVSRK
ncbi:hypothetical protein IAT40_007913 [Kwoniella sp. CBS 6097]